MARSDIPPALYTVLANATAARVRAETRNERAQTALAAARDELANRTQAADDARDAIVDEQTARAAAQAAAAQNTADDRLVRAEEAAMEAAVALQQALDNERAAQDALNNAGGAISTVPFVRPAPVAASVASAPHSHPTPRWLRWVLFTALGLAILALLLGLWHAYSKANDSDTKSALAGITTKVDGLGRTTKDNTEAIKKLGEGQTAIVRRLDATEDVALKAKEVGEKIAKEVEALKKCDPCKARRIGAAAGRPAATGAAPVQPTAGINIPGHEVCRLRANGTTRLPSAPKTVLPYGQVIAISIADSDTPNATVESRKAGEDCDSWRARVRKEKVIID